MSIFFEFHVGASGRRFRRAVDGDKAHIELFIDSEHTEKIFQPVDIGSLIELSTLSICMINEDKEVIGFMALNDYPNVDSVDPADWELWIRNMYQRFYLSRNTLFIHFMCCKDSATDYFLEEALVSVFNNDVYLSQIVLLVSPECGHDNLSHYNVTKRRNMNKYPARRDEDADRFHFLYAALRQDHCPKMKIRRAVEEDNDDICDILDKRSPRLKEIYGAYYISEILAYDQESNRKIIVAEHQERAVGVMCLSPNINYKKLQNTYETRPYYGLMKATPLEREQLKRSNKLLSTFGDPVMSGKLCPFYKLGVEEDNKNITISDASKENTSIENTSTKDLNKDKTKINFKRKVSINNPRERQSSGFQTKTDSHYSEDFSDLMRSQSSLLTDTTNLLDADDCDYDIVNIDVSVLNVLPDLPTDYPGSSQENYYGQSHQSDLTRRIKRRSMMKPADSDMYHYNGEPNAFMIELFGLHEDLNERRGFDLLEAAFEIMKNFDYCIIRVPSADTCFPLLQHFCLVPTKPRICCTYSLYVAHRSSVLGRLRVREAEFIDVPLISRLFQNIQGRETIWMVEHCIYNVENRKHQAFVFMSGLSIVGIGIVEPPEKLKLLRAKFNLDTYHNHKYHEVGCGTKVGFSAVVSVLTYPVFETHYRFFAREMMRLSGSNSLVWMTAYRSKWVAHKANCIVSAMVPVLPRKCDFDFSDVPELLKLSSMSQNIMAFCTWFLDKKLTTVPIVSVGTKIVVLGASRTSMAFLNTLLFGDSSTYLSFTNITMISPNGLPYIRSYNPAAEMMFPKFLNNTDKYLKSVPYTYYVNIVQGTMTEINKADRYISLTNGGRYYYDFLFLLFGKQYQHPQYLKELYERDMRKETYVSFAIPRDSFEPEVMSNETPDNVFIINNISEANKALKYIRNYHNEYHDSQILVYGATIDTYCCLAALMEINVSASNIIFVEPFPPEDPYKPRVSTFYNSYVDETVAHVLDNLGIKVYRGHYFQTWRVMDNYVTHVEFLAQAEVVTFECSAFFYYGKRGVNTEAFFAVNKAGIAYDAGILIDHEFRTKDPRIYAAGPATAYYSRYYAPTKKQKYYDSYDIGEKLGTLIKSMLDPLFSDRQKPARNNSNVSCELGLKSVTVIDPSPSSHNNGYNEKLPDLQKPKVIYCRLPGGLQYLEVRSPGKKIPHYYLQSLHHSGIVMETFKGGYFKIHLTTDLIVDGVTCLTPSKFSVESFKNLYGRSSVCLNNVYMRYSSCQIDLQTMSEDGDVKIPSKGVCKPVLNDLLIQNVNTWGNVQYNIPLRHSSNETRTGTSIAHRHIPPIPHSLDCKIDDPFPERVCGRDMIIEKETYKTTSGEYCVKPNPNKAMERADCSINCKRVIFMTAVEKKLQGKGIIQPIMLSEMKDNFRGIQRSPLMPPEIIVDAPDPNYIFDVKAASRNEAPCIPETANGYCRLLDPYVTTYRACHRPFSVEDQYGIGAKDQITYYTALNTPKVKGFGPRHKEVWEPQLSKVHRSVYDRIHVKKEVKEVAACHNPVNNLKGVFISETKTKYKVPFAQSDLASWSHGETFDLAPFPPNPFQTTIAPFMYCSDYCHIAQGTPPYIVIDQAPHRLPVHKPCVERRVVSRDG